MCGIVGIAAPHAVRYRDALQRMTDSLGHRGPDEQGLYFFANCAFGHRRLSIVDLRTGQQPMLSADGLQGITFNGEIYGFTEIRRRLLSEVCFRTTSDTEVILALYRRYGTELLDRLPGMFAFALWDEETQSLFCARDRFGEKPLYYAVGNHGEFIFASEIKAIVASGLISPQLDKASLAHYLKKLYVPAERTIYRNIHSLPPAHCLVYDGEDISPRRYWKLPAPVQSIGIDDAAEQLKELLSAAVDRQMVADVEVGAFLSGGLDSSTVVALAAERHPRLKTISFGFGESASELPYARDIAERYATEHTEILAGDYPLEELLCSMSTVYDEPFADSSCIPTYIICAHAAKSLKVVLTGDGADELLGGYDYWYKPLYWAERARNERISKINVARAVAFIGDRLNVIPSGTASSLRDGYHLSLHGEVSRLHAMQNCFFSSAEMAAFGLPDCIVKNPELYGGVDDALRMDLVDYLPGDILVKTDRASMANGLELRLPFLDVEVATFLASLPAALKIDAETDKLLLRKAFAQRWSHAVRRRAKQGFGAPVEVWLQRQEMSGLVKQSLCTPGSRLFDLFDGRYLQGIAGENSYRTWIMLVLSLWLERHPCEI